MSVHHYSKCNGQNLHIANIMWKIDFYNLKHQVDTAGLPDLARNFPYLWMIQWFKCNLTEDGENVNIQISK